jgi:uncharacterized membrane protein
MKKILFFWRELKASFWFIPVLIIILSIPTAIGFAYLDDVVTLSRQGLQRYFFVNSSDSARSILSTISGAMVGVAGTVFSVTLVALTLASSQLGPRIIKNFMYVRLNQVVLGAYVATYLYCLIILNTIKGNNGFTFIPSISILFALILAVVNIVLLIVFIHQITISLQADKMISDIHKYLTSQITTLFPDEQEKIEYINEEQANNIKLLYSNIISLKSHKSGYLQYLALETLIEQVAIDNSLLELKVRTGDYIVKDSEIGKIYQITNAVESRLEKIKDQFIIGKTRTSQQDFEFSIHQMVEIASKALSPGVNDPFTAIACIDNLTAVMSYLTQVRFPPRYLFDKDKNLRIISDTFNFEGVLNAAFNQIRQFSSGNPAVIIKLMEALITLSKFTTKESDKKAVINHAKMVLNVGKTSIKEENDLKDLIERADYIISSSESDN